MTDFYNLTLAESTLFENYLPTAYDDLLISLKIANERITNAILKTKGEWTRQKLNEVKKLINDEIQSSYGGLFEGIKTDSVNVAEVVLGATIGNSLASLPKPVIADLLNSNRQIQGYGFKELFDLTSENHARQLKVLLSSGVSQGLTAEQIVRAYGIKSDKLTKGQLVSNIFTTISDSRDQGRYAGYRELEKDGVSEGYIYDATLDSNTTVYCREHDQRVYNQPIDEIQSEIKVHFHCRSVFRPIPKLSQSETRASQFGQTKNEPYKEWFMKQSDDFKKLTLTNRQYDSFIKGNYKVNSIVDLEKRVSLKNIKKQLLYP